MDTKTLIKNWKFGLILIGIFLFSLALSSVGIYPSSRTLTWLGFFLLIGVCGFIYELAKFLDRRRKKKK